MGFCVLIIYFFMVFFRFFYRKFFEGHTDFGYEPLKKENSLETTFFGVAAALKGIPKNIKVF